MNTSHRYQGATWNRSQESNLNWKDRIVSIFSALRASRKTLLLIVIVAVVSIAGTSIISVLLSNSSSEIYIPSLGTIKTIEVEAFSDAGCQHKKDALEWAEIEPGESISTSVYIKSVSNFNVMLTLNLTDWSPPEISDYLTLTWDYKGTRLDPGEVILINLNVSAPSSDDFINYLVDNEIKNFTVDVHFIAKE